MILRTRGASARGPARAGVVLPIVAVLLVLVSGGALMLQYASRQRYREAHRHTSGQVALALAESGLNVCLEALWVGARTHGTSFHRLLVETPPEDLDGHFQVLEDPHLGLATELLEDAQLEVRLEVRGVRGFLPLDGVRGVERDHREKFGEVVLTSSGTYRGVTRSFKVARPFKVVDVTAPVVSKFTLFVRRHGDVPVNCLTYDRLLPGSPLALDDQPAQPLVLLNRPESLPTLDADAFHPMADLFADVALDEAGLVFLGGDQPWYLNLVHGSGAGLYEELFHLRRARMMSESTAPGGGFDARIWFGFYRGILESQPLRGAALRRPTGEAVDERTSALHLYGDVTNVSPTVVLGPVYRSYVLVPLLDGLWFPYLDSADYGGAGAVLSPYGTYARYMTQVVADPYNRSFDFLRTNTERLEPSGLVAADEGMPFEPPAYLLAGSLRRIQPADGGDETFLYPEVEPVSRGTVALVRPTEEGDEEVFRGALADLDGELMARMLRAKAVEEVEDQAELFERFLDGNRLDLPGIVRVRRGNVTLDKVLVVSAGMLLVEGDVAVEGYVTSKEPAATFTVASLEGDITLRTADVVEASLVCLNGTLRGHRGQLVVHGGVAADKLDLPSLVAGNAAKRLVWNPALDPTEDEAYRHHLRFFLGEGQAMWLEGH